MMSNKKKKIALAVSLSLLAILIIIAITLGVCLGRKPKKPQQEKKETPLDFPKYNKPDKKVVDNADYYVSVNEGNDTNDLSKLSKEHKKLCEKQFAKIPIPSPKTS